ncbi:hypothetical protein BDV26DRAFT_268283 [Aspergillus bertholletiae]|uniref:BHLH domain-containing protein n=1 Tax=Aspergillus bertholletiae TaxID=1226010 RepID=A0A5N7AZE3_9EURO|nr:hypothetical protein BDV26DRAFT_268283 [Aspergillus bertholletiae]
MSRSRLPPTPAMSGELIVKDQMSMDAGDSFALPPAAMSPAKMDSASRRSSKSDHSVYFPASPTSPNLNMGRGANPPRQAGIKRPLEDFDLPPPPTRTRKIIQMKPKTQTQSQPKPAPSASKPSSKESGKSASNNASPATSKKKQPSATSAAGRKIARKTAHSLIERRRRSKMNEEFATLKDMIPACRGQDMHKLAILQASIDYVNYLEQCIHDLKTAGDSKTAVPQRMPPAPPSPSSPEVLGEVAGSIYSASVSPDILPSGCPTNVTSPAFSPRSRIPSTGTAIDFSSSILPSPALGPVHPCDSALRSSRGSWAATSTNPSPVLQPQARQASSAEMDHEASAALLMLNRDCRGSVGSLQEEHATPIPGDRQFSLQDTQRKVGMSVKDLLIS